MVKCADFPISRGMILAEIGFNKRACLRRCVMPEVKKILAPTDFSELSKLGIRYAFDLARNRGAEVIFYHIIDLGEEWPGIRTERTRYHDMLEEHRRLLDKFIADSFPE